MGFPAGWYDDGSGNFRWWDGSEWDDSRSRARNEFDERPPRKRLTAGRKFALFAAVTAAVCAAIFAIALSTARHWTKVEIPEQAETFHSEDYATGLLIVADDGVSPCYEGQDWVACMDRMAAEYDRVCVGQDLTPEAAGICSEYGEEITRMQEAGEDGATVGTVGNYGHLQSTPEHATRAVSNEDHRQAVTRRAVCYLGIFGECDGTPSADTVSAEGSPTPTPTSDGSVPEEPDGSADGIGYNGAIPVNPASPAEVAFELDRAADVVGSFWRNHFDEYFSDEASYVPPAVGGIYTSASLPECGGDPIPENNAIYCRPSHTVWWDGAWMRELYSAGDVNVYLIVAHEWGHAIQAQIDEVAEMKEMQADCLAAAALYGAVEDGVLEWEAGDTLDIANAFEQIADEAQWTDSSDHGDIFNRMAWFEYGRQDGVEGCLRDGE